MENMARLPKWAQTRIQVADMRLREAKAELAKVFSKPGTTDTEWREIEDIHPLPDGANIRFRLANNKYDWIEARVVDGVVRIYGQTAISIEPQAANCIYIKQSAEMAARKEK